MQGLSYRDIIRYYNLSGNVALQHCLTRTAQLKYWDIGYEGGQGHYLSFYEIDKFFKILFDNADDINCIPKDMAIEIAYKALSYCPPIFIPENDFIKQFFLFCFGLFFSSF